MNTWISPEIIQALGWTLLHALWQGGLLALVLYGLRPRLASAGQRYWAAYGALVGMLLGAVVTFFQVYAPAPAPVPVEAAAPLPVISVLLESGTEADDPGTGISGMLESCHPWIVGLWFAGFSIFLLRMAAGLRYVRRLRQLALPPADAYWPLRVQALSEQLRLSRPVQLLESALVHTPMALGYFKPLVLFPLGMINRLTPAEVEAILAHELAHIARRDWLFNLLQAFIEALFYYHPAVWWISGMVRAEREHCCDDAAVAVSGNRILYAKTLVQVQEWAKSAPSPALALALSGSASLLRPRPTLLDRIRRVLNQPQPKSHIMEKFVATGILLALLAFCGLRAGSTPVLAQAFQKLAEVPATFFGAQNADTAPLETDSIPKSSKRTQKITQDDGDSRVEMDLENGKITRLVIDGREIPATEYEAHQDLIDELSEATPPPPPPPAEAPVLFYKDGVWGLGNPDRLSIAPMPALPAMPALPGLNGGRIHSEKDADGNTVIIMERGDGSTEIRVKGDEVWIDGKKLEAGESFELEAIPNGFQFNFDGEMPELEALNEMHFYAPEPLELKDGVFIYPDQFQGIYFNGEELDNAGLSKKESKRLKKDLKRQQEDMEAARKDMIEAHREMARAQQQMRVEQYQESRVVQEEIRRAQREAIVAQREAMAAQREAMKEQRAALLAQREAQLEEAKANKLTELMKENLLKDQLIKSKKHFKFTLSSVEMTVNGQKQPAEVHQKYLELYKKNTGAKLDGNWNIFITEDEKD
jgi:bla regulator protein blaR1